MSTPQPTPSTTAPQGHAVGAEQQALLDALDGVLQPLADLCLSKGLTIQAVEERLRLAMVQAAIQAHGHLPATRLTSRISASTGLTRREVARLQADTPQTPARPSRPSSATEVFTRWMADASLRAPDGQPMILPRLGPAPSFERLAQSVTQDVHPRSLLDELCRLGLAQWDTPTDQVRLLTDAFVPRGDWPRMTAFLADNVGDHLRSATANVLGTGKEHLEQAIFADELSAESLAAFKALMTTQWQHMLQSIPLKLEQLIAADKQAGRAQDQRVRVGLYTWAQPMAGVPSAAAAPPLARPQGRRASPKSPKETKL